MVCSLWLLRALKRLTFFNSINFSAVYRSILMSSEIVLTAEIKEPQTTNYKP